MSSQQGRDGCHVLKKRNDSASAQIDPVRPEEGKNGTQFASCSEAAANLLPLFARDLPDLTGKTACDVIVFHCLDQPHAGSL
jgi:hypothetical protein